MLGPVYKLIYWTRFLKLQLISVFFLLLTQGCQTPSLPSDVVTGPDYRITNKYSAGPKLPKYLRRVAVLPLTAREKDVASESGLAVLESVLHSELAKTKKFEIVVIPRTQLNNMTGRPTWDFNDEMPEKFFDIIQERTGADAVLFSQLSVYRPYKPINIGWNICLVDCKTRSVWWAVDEVFDSGNPEIINSARRFYQRELNQQYPLAESISILDSPMRFGQFTLNLTFSTLPDR